MKIIIYIAIGIAIGILVSTLYYRFSLSRSMMLENESKYTFVETENFFFQKVAENDWSILGSHDLQEKMAARGFEVLEARVYDLCKPAYAVQILSQDKERIVSPLLPCRVAIYKKSNGKTYIGRMNSLKMAGFMPGVVPNVMSEAAAEVEEIIEHLIK